MSKEECKEVLIEYLEDINDNIDVVNNENGSKTITYNGEDLAIDLLSDCYVNNYTNKSFDYANVSGVSRDLTHTLKGYIKGRFVSFKKYVDNVEQNG